MSDNNETETEDTFSYEEEHRRDSIEDMRELCDYLEAHPELPLPYWNSQDVFLDSKEQIQALARSHGPWEKRYAGSYLELVKRMSNGLVRYQLNVAREQVCTKRVVGTEIVPAQPERVREIVEWDCHPLLADEEEVK